MDRRIGGRIFYLAYSLLTIKLATSIADIMAETVGIHVSLTEHSDMQLKFTTNDR